MRQFYELYGEDEKVSPLVTQLGEKEKVSTLLTQLSRTNHLQIMSACKSAEERDLYMLLRAKEKYGTRELARQIASACLILLISFIFSHP